MKTLLTIAISLAFATTAVRAQTAADYQSTISGQSPTYDFNFDNSLSSVGNTATFTASGTAGFGSDAWGNANDAVSFSALTDYLSLASPLIISGAGTLTAIGSMSMLFYMPSTVPSTAYLFSDSDVSPYFALGMSGGVFSLKIANKSFTIPTPTANTWYYFGLTYNLNGTVTGVNGATWYLGAVGGTLSSGFLQKGGSGNINTTTTMGDGGTFILGNRRAENNTLVDGEIDELATWNTALSSSQIDSQFAALIVPVPEPSACILFGAGGLLVLWTRRIPGMTGK